MASEAGFDLKIRVIEFATSFKQAQAGEFQIFQITGAAGSILTATPTPSCTPRRRRTTASIPIRKPTRRWKMPGSSPIRRSAKAIYEKADQDRAQRRAIIYIYHRKLLIAHTTRLEGYKQMPDGLVRVVD